MGASAAAVAMALGVAPDRTEPETTTATKAASRAPGRSERAAMQERSKLMNSEVMRLRRNSMIKLICGLNLNKMCCGIGVCGI